MTTLVQHGLALCATADNSKASPFAQQVCIAEIGSGSGGTSVVVMAALAPFADHVDFLYTDISPALVGYGRKTYGGLYPFARFQLLDVEKDVQGEGIGSYDVVFGTNVLHATRNMTNTLQNCKALLRKGDGWHPCQTADHATMSTGDQERIKMERTFSTSCAPIQTEPILVCQHSVSAVIILCAEDRWTDDCQ